MNVVPPKHGIIHSDEMYSCLELNVEEYRSFGHAMNFPTAKYMCHQREAIIFGQRAKSTHLDSFLVAFL